MYGYFLAANEVSLQEAEFWYKTNIAPNTDGDLEVQNSRFVKDKYGRCMTPMPQSPSRTEKTGPSRMAFEGLRPAPLRLLVRKGVGVSRTTDNAMTDSHTPSQGSDGSRSNPVRLSRRTAIRASTRNRDTATERRDSKINTRFPVITSYHTLILQPTPQPPTHLRRFSFEEESGAFTPILAGREITTELPTTKSSQAVGPTPCQPRKSTSPPVTEAQQHRRASTINSRQPPLSLAEELRAVGETTPEYEVEKVAQRRIPTTFEEMLGERRIPTALL
jgi:hypothetical protein